RKSRERNRTDSRSIEIQRLIGRALRSAVDLEKIGDVSIYIDCDVLDADGGTRCASINGGMVALYEALLKMQREAVIEELPVTAFVAAISVGLRDGQMILDLDYEADSTADVDMNVVMNENGDLIEVQGTAEHHPFSRSQLDAMLDLAWEGIRLIIAEQKRVIATLN
ncbi:MAG: ribonuclease PH, partial [Lentisphaerae bacterium]